MDNDNDDDDDDVGALCGVQSSWMIMLMRLLVAVARHADNAVMFLVAVADNDNKDGEFKLMMMMMMTVIMLFGADDNGCK